MTSTASIAQTSPRSAGRAPDHRFCVAPMMACTDRHDRYFLRLISRHALLYTEMVTTGALLHGDRAGFLAHHETEHPLALQIGGSEPAAMADCARFAEQAGFDEVNINVGCPSDRVRRGRFGVCLMLEPDLVAHCVAQMRAAVRIPVTVKCRIGVDERDRPQDLERFVETVAGAGCETFVIHARKAWLSGLSPRQNREVPPLRYDRVLALKRRFPALELVLNGGITTLDDARRHLERLDGVMVGREAYRNPYLLAEVDAQVFGARTPAPSRREVIERLLEYVEIELARGTRLHAITRHVIGLYQGLPGARAWRRHLSENATRPGAGAEVLAEAARLVPANA